MMRESRLVPDSAYPGMWRVRWPDDCLSDMANLTRARDAVACFTETARRRQRGRQSPLEDRWYAKTRRAGDRPYGFTVAPTHTQKSGQIT